MRRSKRLEGVARRLLAAAAVVLVITLAAFGQTACYLTRGAWEEAKILSRRRSITDMLSDPKTDPATRAKLRIVEAARTFARDSLGLTTKESFTTYSYVDHDTLVLVLSAAYPDKLERYTWSFPVVGQVPYKGYFDFAQAKKAAGDLKAQGFDVELRPSDAFSTLGFFNDPLLNTSLRADSLELANTVIHELTHNTFYASGQVTFNESFASFVGSRGAERFFASRGDSMAARLVASRWEDEKLLGRFWHRLSATLDSAFRANRDSRTARLDARKSIYGAARRTLVDTLAFSFATIPPRYAERVPLDNASLLARRVYASGLDTFDLLLARNGGDLRRTVKGIIALARAHPASPYAGVDSAASAPPRQ